MINVHDPLRNPLDPLHKLVPDTGRRLFQEMAQQAASMPFDVVADASCVLLINVLRQSCSNWYDAERAFDELFGRSKELLKIHYDVAGGGRRKGVFPYDQEIQAVFVQNKSDFFRG